MNKQEFEELFPIDCVVSHDVKEKISSGKWEKVWLYEFPYDNKFLKSENNRSTEHILDIDELPSHSFGIVEPLKPTAVYKFSYKRIG